MTFGASIPMPLLAEVAWSRNETFQMVAFIKYVRNSNSNMTKASTLRPRNNCLYDMM